MSTAPAARASSMTMKSLVVLTCAATLIVSCTRSTADPFDGVRAAIRHQLVQRRAPSIAVAVARGNQIVWQEGFGWADRERHIAATADTMYSLASISKPLTGTALMTLVHAGKLELDRPINDYLGPAKLRARIGDVRAATVRRVANHSAGLPEHYQFFYRNEPWRVPSPDETILRFGNLTSPPGELFRYSNLGYGVLSHVIARRSGTSFADYMRQAVFLPLGMTRSAVGNDPTLAEYEALRYGEDDRPIARYDTDHPGASELYTSAHDLVRFGMFSLKAHLDDQAAILPDAMIDAMQQPTMDEGEGKGYGVGWETSTLAGVRVLAHTGGMPGVATVLRVVPAQRLVVVVLCNAEDFELVSTIADQIMATALPGWQPAKREPPPPIAAFHPTPDLIGVWKGTLSTYEDEIPLTLTIPASGDVHIQVGAQWETLVHNPLVGKSGAFHGLFTGSMGPTMRSDLSATQRRPYVISLNLRPRGDGKLAGELTARADNSGVTSSHGLFPAVGDQPAPETIQAKAFLVSQWAELTRTR